MRRIIGLELCLLRTQNKMTLSEAASKSGVMTLSEAASKSGVSKKNIKLIESGRTFSLHKVAVLAAIYEHELRFELREMA